jgi:mono/diheme cytochrome c family protein
VKVTLFFAIAGAALAAPDPFSSKIRPVLQENCGGCHNPANPRNKIDFLKSESPTDVETRRVLWRDVATQLRNRTMPPGAAKIPEADRMLVANWIDERLRTTGCTTGEYAGFVASRRLNRREWKNTIRDLFGLDVVAPDLFPADEAGGAGFDTNGETLYVPPMMLERYMEAATAVLDRIVVTPPFNKVVLSHEMNPVTAPPAGIKPSRFLEPGAELSTQMTVFAEGAYSLRVSVERPKLTPFTMKVLVDGVAAGTVSYARDSGGGATARVVTATLARGPHTVTVINGTEKIEFYSLTVDQRPAEVTSEKRALHFRLLGLEVGQSPAEGRTAARRILTRLLPKAYRGKVEPAEIDRLLALYDRGARRGEPFEENVKLALKAVLISPRFLFKVETSDPAPGIRPVGQFEMASRLSYFLWSTMPDEELFRLASEGKLQDTKVLAAQVERMIDDPRSRVFAGGFVGQWLGTQDIGGRAAPLLTELQHFYTPEGAADLREQPELFFHHILTANKPVLDLLTANYTFLTERLVKYYELEGKVKLPPGPGFHLVQWPDDRRAGVLGLASILAMTSHYKQASPVLRGAWVLETLLGTPVPPPPADVPPLEAAKGGAKKMTVRAMLAKHRESVSCSACHNLMDPIGLGLENFDWMGRWRDKDDDGEAVDATGALPSGEKFNGPVELRTVLMRRKEEFSRQITSKLLGYALGRALQDGDQCTVQKLMDSMEKNGYQTRTLIRDIVMSIPFRNTQADAAVSESRAPVKKAPRRLLGTK